ncbi:4-hydroxybenzoate octaprenyltransferase [Paracoccus suum]|uniref:4-hydroxybenzoate octaprenyltransferase n=1 Tax=Paracoccus suum TaxID=2259340 RepID=A0A344PIE1_9RHOB|nr:4-hydroxybenzoate octaprenyltransferase [Paracoccus suum]AXC49146.1 4-hydroxybenzoate octaprenyltransferase [Paracoccus suum]
MAAARAAPAAAPIPADTPAGNWVDRLAPPGWRPWLRLSRADRPIGTWLLLLPCWWGLGLAMIAHGPAWRDLWITLVCGLGALVMRGAGCTWNDLADRDIDARVARTRARPLPSGQVTPRGALVWLAVQALVGLALLLTLGPAAIWLGVASLVPVAVYPFAKRFTWWPQAFLGVAFNWGALLAYAAHAGRLEAPALVLWLGGIAWTLFYDTIYAHQDIEDDALIGVKSTARLFGDDTGRWLTRFAVVATVLLALAVWLAAPTGWAALPACAAVLSLALHLAWQRRVFRPGDTAMALRLFRSNRDAGLAVALFLAMAGLA